MKNIPVFVFILALFTVNSCAQNTDKFKIRSDILNEERTIEIYLPVNYANSTQKNYPVLYILDGDYEFKTTCKIVSSLAEDKKTPEMIIAGIYNAKNRVRDFTPFSDQKWPDSGGGDKFLDFLTSELIPHVEKTYRTTKERLLFGHSFAGLFSAYAMAKVPGLFSCNIISSGYLNFGKDAVFQVAEDSFAERTKWDNFVYVTIGGRDRRKDFIKAAEKFTGLLKNSAPAGLKWKYKLYKGENHESMPPISLMDGLIEYFKDKEK